VKDVLFPYVLNNLDDYVGEMMMAAEDDDYARASSSDLLDALRGDVDALDDAHPAKVELSSGPAAADGAEVIKLIVKTLMKHDVKATVSSGEERSGIFMMDGTGLTNSHDTQMRKKNILGHLQNAILGVMRTKIVLLYRWVFVFLS